LTCEICEKPAEIRFCSDCNKMVSMLLEMYEIDEVVRMTSIVLGEKMVYDIMDNLIEEDS